MTHSWLSAVVLGSVALFGCAPGGGEAPQSSQAAAAAEIAPAALVASDAHDWPHWRGPTHDGVSTERGWKTTWDTPPETLWKTNVGTGFSSLSVAAGRVYTMGHKEGQDTVYCLNVESGEPLWKHTYLCEIVDNLHEGGPATTPTVDGDRVYTLSKEGHLFCLGASTGEVLWSKELQSDLDIKMPVWGFSCSPLVWKNLLIIEAGRVVAYDKQSGEKVWETEKFKPGYGSPHHFTREGEDLIAVLNNEALLVVRAADGAEVARTKWETSYETSSTTPQVIDGKIFLSTGYNRGCALLELADGKLEYVYENKNMSNHMNNAVLWKGHLYGFNGNSHASGQVKLTCLDFATGERKWQQKGLGCGSLMLAGGKLVILSDRGELVIAEPSPDEYQPLGQAEILKGKCWTVPVLANGRLYARNAAGDLVCVDLRN